MKNGSAGSDGDVADGLAETDVTAGAIGAGRQRQRRVTDALSGRRPGGQAPLVLHPRDGRQRRR